MKCPKCGFSAENYGNCPICGTQLFSEEVRFQNTQNQADYAYTQSVAPPDYPSAEKKSNGSKPLVITALVFLGLSILAGLIISVYSAVVYNKTAYEALYNKSDISVTAAPFSD